MLYSMHPIETKGNSNLKIHVANGLCQAYIILFLKNAEIVCSTDTYHSPNTYNNALIVNKNVAANKPRRIVESVFLPKQLGGGGGSGCSKLSAPEF